MREIEQDMLDLQPVRARKADPRTSKEAAAAVSNSGVRKRILETLSEHPEGLASWEIADLMGVPRDYVSPHMQPLKRLGCIKLLDRLRYNVKTRRNTQVWAV